MKLQNDCIVGSYPSEFKSNVGITQFYKRSKDKSNELHQNY